MGSLVIKIDTPTKARLKNLNSYSDIDMFTMQSKYEGVPFVYDAEAVKQSIRNILMWRVGESILRPEFGHRLDKSMYEQLNSINKEKVCNEIQRALEENEPRIQIQGIGVKKDSETEDDDNNTLHIKVLYVVKGGSPDDVQMVEQTTVLGK